MRYKILNLHKVAASTLEYFIRAMWGRKTLSGGKVHDMIIKAISSDNDLYERSY